MKIKESDELWRNMIADGEECWHMYHILSAKERRAWAERIMWKFLWLERVNAELRMKRLYP